MPDTPAATQNTDLPAANLPPECLLDIQQSIEIKTDIATAFKAMLAELGPDNKMPDGTSMQMVLEAFPGGRWMRDLGNDEGHLWGHIQVIKAPTLLEITGPMFMSYPAVSHIQFRLTEQDNHTLLSLRHQAIGLIDPDHRQGVTMGWASKLQGVRDHAESK